MKQLRLHPASRLPAMVPSKSGPSWSSDSSIHSCNRCQGGNMIDTTSPSSSELALTADQIARATRHLAGTRDALVESVTGFSPLQWGFRPNYDSWSTAEILEHLALMEGRIHVI